MDESILVGDKLLNGCIESSRTPVHACKLEFALPVNTPLALSSDHQDSYVMSSNIERNSILVAP